jgi:hypothetical protein
MNLVQLDPMWRWGHDLHWYIYQNSFVLCFARYCNQWLFATMMGYRKGFDLPGNREFAPGVLISYHLPFSSFNGINASIPVYFRHAIWP